MDRAKDLFYLLDDQQEMLPSAPSPRIAASTGIFGTSGGGDPAGDMWPIDYEQQSIPRGTVSAKSLAVELAAGGITIEHAEQVWNLKYGTKFALTIIKHM